MEKIIAQGAEALLLKKDGILIKKRISKGYRHKELDKKLIEGRTRREAKLLGKARSIIATPKIINVGKNEINMEFINGKKLNDFLDKAGKKEALKICKILGNETAKLHKAGIIHGDLTTSNMIWHQNKVWLIDFGLGFHSSKVEDKAVDLHLLRQALESKHFMRWHEYFNAFINGYKNNKDCKKILKQLEKVEARGRYKGKH